MDGLLLTDVVVGGFDGVIGEVKIYNRALSQDEIKAGSRITNQWNRKTVRCIRSGAY